MPSITTLNHRLSSGAFKISDYENILAFLQKQANVLSEYVINSESVTSILSLSFDDQ
ncbi:MAG: hypothetical protein VSS75_031815 [Candidatus Parabeggiatoa sp.]